MSHEVIDVDALSDDEIQFIRQVPSPDFLDLTTDSGDASTLSHSRLPSVGASNLLSDSRNFRSQSSTQPIASNSRISTNVVADDAPRNLELQRALGNSMRIRKLSTADGPPAAKRLRTLPPSRPKRSNAEVIELSDDEDVQPPIKRMKVEPPPEQYSMVQPRRSEPDTELNSEDFYQTFHAALDLHHAPNWKALPHSHISSDGLAKAMATLSIANTQARRPKKLKGSLIEPSEMWPHRPLREGAYYTHMLSHHVDIVGLAARSLQAVRRRGEHIDTRRRATNNLWSTPLVSCRLQPSSPHVFVQAQGAINRVAQSSGLVAMSAAAVEGPPEDEEDPAAPFVDPDDSAGGLQIWQNGKCIILDSHMREFTDRRRISDSDSPRRIVKHYSVNAVKFDPNNTHCMASAGNDGTVQLWKSKSWQVDDDSQVMCSKILTYPDAPHDLFFRPEDSMLAVPCKDGFVYTYTQNGYGSCTSLPVPPAGIPHSAGAMVWGHHCTLDLLFASSEPKDPENDHTGFHRAFDLKEETVLFSMGAKEAGDAMAIDADGARLALFTTDEDSHTLRLYDVRRRTGRRSIDMIKLEPFAFESPPGEVTTASFSPDGILLAVARNDDALHMYDTRFLERGPLARYLHKREDRDVDMPRYGVAEAVWISGWQGFDLGLVSGGTDGCVRYWDTRRSADGQEGEILAQVSDDIGHFALGDPYKGEKPLVV
ncbi:WD40 repeat-like protein [Auriscalpium vulgare]|uniref:WD40 repeat-like protein n=1 Tax=Auriscalpium vulgare TaxID=40419 RepID=A0ACB8RVU6_9AGAM|nr:WD40 repeat-like protein [Auriscalpium vulgare]